MSKKILVLGAGGNVGRPLVKALIARGESVKAATRSGAGVEGAEGVAFDYADPSTFDAAFADVDRAYVMLPTGYVNISALLLPVVQGLAARGVKIVFQSVFGVDADDSIPYRQVELAVEAAGVPFVILRPNWFADNFHTFWHGGILQGGISLPAGQGKSSFIDVRDIAESAAAALTRKDFDGQAFNLTGPHALSYAEAATVLGQVIGRPVAYQAIDDASFIATLTAHGVPDDYAQFLASIFHPVREGWTAPVSDAVLTLTGHPARSLQTYAADHAAHWAA